MRYTPSGATPGWEQSQEGVLTTRLHGVEVEVTLSGSSTRIDVVATNATGHDVELRMGGEGTPSDLAIGELLERPIVREPGSVGPNYQPYRSMLPHIVPTGTRTVFNLDQPLGRDPSYGLFFVFMIEGRRDGAGVERRTVPLTAQHVDTAGDHGGV